MSTNRPDEHVLPFVVFNYLKKYEARREANREPDNLNNYGRLRYSAMKRLILTLLLVLTPLPLNAEFRDHFRESTLRIDYLHSGNSEKEEYQRIAFIEEHRWAGSKTLLEDPFDYGYYKIEMVDLQSEELLYARGYATLFREWQRTEDAKSGYRSFYEAVTMPMPRHAVRIDFLSRNHANDWEKKYSVDFIPRRTELIRRKNLRCRRFQIHYSGNPNEKLDIVILPEGYTREEWKKLREDCLRFKEYLLQSAPFNENRDKINIWGVNAWSKESGTDIPSEGIYKDTILNTSFDAFGIERYITTEDFKAVKDLASCAPYDRIIILVNHSQYGGGGIYNHYAMVTSDNEDSDFVLLHEFSHALAGLGDEYYSSGFVEEPFYPLDIEPWEPNLTTLVDFESKWMDMVDDETPIPTPATPEYDTIVGVYEGGGYVDKGVYRPFMDCTMKSRIYDGLCPVCLRAVQDMIDSYME
ncbi:MAG: peptidase M64 [Deltaproteobacteria bacterium]|nr:peptidase M64 [Deltaproteobacteria bacterium]